jgi:hypothetical protein
MTTIVAVFGGRMPAVRLVDAGAGHDAPFDGFGSVPTTENYPSSSIVRTGAYRSSDCIVTTSRTANNNIITTFVSSEFSLISNFM